MSGLLRFALVLFAAASPPAASPAVPSGPNCDLQAPPPNSGEVMGDEQEFDLKVYPRYKDFPSQYTGCQISWVSVHDRWQQFSMAYFENGRPVLLLGPGALGGRKAELVCRYHGKKLVAGTYDECPESAGVVLKSMPS